MKTLFLQTQELQPFEGLSEQLREGWKTETETEDFQDSAEQMLTRLQLLHVHDPKLLAFRDSLLSAKDNAAMESILMDTDLSSINDDDIAELFFALGPQLLSALIVGQLPEIKTEQDMYGLQALTTIRHALLITHKS